MKNIKEKKEKLAIVLSIIYIIIMGIGMFTMNHVFDIQYSDPHMVTIIIFVEIILTAFVLFANYKWFNNSGFDKLEKSQLKWFLPIAILIVLTFVVYIFTSDWGNVNYSLVSLIFVTCLFVGISEEVMFRGIVLHTYLKTGTKVRAIIISSVTFSLLHSVNILAGLSLGQMLSQLTMTFVVGILFACIVVKIDNILPLILYHGLWDALVISSKVTGAKINGILLLLTITHLILAIVYLKSIKKEEKISILKEEKI